MNPRCLNTCLTVLLAVCVLVPAVAQEAQPDSYHYMYFDQPRGLELDASRIAVWTPAETAVAPALRAAGVNPAAWEAVGVNGWRLYALAEPARNASMLETLVAELALHQTVQFVSPVFIAPSGRLLLMTPHLHVGFDHDLSRSQAEQVLTMQQAGTIEVRDFAGLPGVYRIRTALRDGFEVLALANKLVGLPEVEFAESDMIMRGELFLIPNDPLFGQQWALDQTNDEDLDAPEAWDITTGSSTIEVVVMDSGIQQNHPDINQLPGQDFTSAGTPNGGPANSCDNHATTVAGCVSAVINNNRDVVGIAPDCIVRSAKMGTTIEFLGICTPFLDAQPSYVANALNWSVSIGARVTNSSFGFDESATMTTAYDQAFAAGVVNVAATGNSGSGSISYPSSLSSVIAVGAMSSNGALASFSQYGAGIAFCAPGEQVLTSDRTGADGYGAGDTVTVDGTSYSSPYAAGVAALVLSVDPALTPTEVEQIMNQSCVDKGAAGYDTTYGWGFLNAHNAVLAAQPEYEPGDMNCDGIVDFSDINPFVLALTDPPAYTALYGDCDIMNADLSGDGTVGFEDINPFVVLLT